MVGLLRGSFVFIADLVREPSRHERRGRFLEATLLRQRDGKLPRGPHREGSFGRDIGPRTCWSWKTSSTPGTRSTMSSASALAGTESGSQTTRAPRQALAARGRHSRDLDGVRRYPTNSSSDSGIDYAQRNRNLPYIGKVRFKPDDLVSAHGPLGAPPAVRRTGEAHSRRDRAQSSRSWGSNRSWAGRKGSVWSPPGASAPRVCRPRPAAPPRDRP